MLRRLVGTVVAAIVAICAVNALRAQTPTTEQTRSFEVASIKKDNSGDTRWVYQMDPGGRFRVTRASLANLISIAYGTSSPLPGFQVLGGPNWIRTDRFDVVAKSDGNPTKDDFPLMLRSLLAERFNLRVHHEARERDVFALVTARRDRRLGPGLRRTDLDCTFKGDTPPTSNSQAPSQK